ncbi:hypothetical protein BD779DRAFT_1496543 [Infundibulicybe gibba]|nr:hypothetical protein BD779DRAFT_1496543 [Infundibulicybe gibba]
MLGSKYREANEEVSLPDEDLVPQGSDHWPLKRSTTVYLLLFKNAKDYPLHYGLTADILVGLVCLMTW